MMTFSAVSVNHHFMSYSAMLSHRSISKSRVAIASETVEKVQLLPFAEIRM
jgi:hypothetical protein